jgi:hypothetical protein
MLTFIICCRRSLQSKSTLDLCSGSTAGSPAEPDFLQLCVGRLAIVPEFQGNSGNGILVAAVPFLETSNLPGAKAGE